MHHLAFLAITVVTITACSDPSDPPPASTADLEVVLGDVTIPANTDAVYCDYVPADGVEHWLASFTTDMTAGSHHLIVFRVDESRGTAPVSGRRECDQLELPEGVDGMLPGSQRPHTEVRLPEGVAMKLGSQHGLFFQYHYVNASDAPLEADIVWHATAIEPIAVENTAGMMFFSNFELSVPPGPSVASRACPLTTERTLLGVTGHMHRRGVALDATLDGAPLFHTDSWSEPELLELTPPLSVGVGASLGWSCSYFNDEGTTYTFGPSATANEMCIFAGLYFPAPDSMTDFGC